MSGRLGFISKGIRIVWVKTQEQQSLTKWEGMFFVSSALIAARNLWSDVSEGLSGLNNMLLGHIKHGILSQSDSLSITINSTVVASSSHINPATIFMFDEGRKKKDLGIKSIHRLLVFSGNHGAQSVVALDSWSDDQADGRSSGATTRRLGVTRSRICVRVSLD